jgi:hypothetical protein
MTSKNIEIVVARYNEDLAWTNEAPFNKFKYTVYNKGVNDLFENKYVNKIVKLPNVGRCDHTYLYHIVHNFNNLAPITVFFPGSLNHPAKKTNAVKMLNAIMYHKTAIFLGTRTHNLRAHFNSFKLDEWKCSDPKNAALNSEKKLLPAIIRPYGAWYQFHFGNIIVKYWCIHGIFSMHKKDIIKHNIERYRKILAGVERHSNPEVGHYIERSWAAIFHPLLFTKVI